ncbi:MAG: hypothetical protein OQJ97_15220 [Rhodospirillales bacterium]|nr:hypothetical protein [Rhodospirillales bacterium]
METAAYQAASLFIAAVSASESANQAKRQGNAQKQKEAIQNKRLAETYKIEERKRKEVLKKNLASKRARMSATGYGAGQGGSGSAVLAGLVSKSEQERQDSAKKFGLGLEEIQANNLLKPQGTSLSDGLRLGLQGASLLHKVSQQTESKPQSN